ncbi:uncharacterized protein LAESUDRAFT_720925 [Laetiporus sulphureus 93-53]|uniref:Uncharacterized protein n=1 Tax=Laetiporus sulphureus 93-53 TaxID=1314785 RepID=A0A165GNG8_9APHY|nr:uncharacterized protein LAESUDRAFT_720925 [Laetiporus sulphureus 93-53]KZT10590.1 hypothetical protein LAESUDRAFT_720925 [Laetiporus sulphureus 93-53]
MPVVSRPQRTEAIQAKYNVTIDFPHLGLHSAAANGNLGLVKYALEHGQPINSVLDGVLPLHVACSGGNDMVVRLLIDRGADVNAPRLPRRYSSEKSRDGSQPIVGTSGSTPLHFACANGHLSIVLILLMHGAHPDRADKHGTTPEMLARQNGFAACADVLQQWSHNKDRDLRAKDELTLSQNRDSGAGTPGETHPYCGNLDCRICAGRKRLRVKKSIDNALNMLKPSSSHVHSPSHLDEPVHVLETILASPVMPAETLGDTSLHSIVTPTTGADHFARRPSLPDVVNSQQSDPSMPQSHSHSSKTRRPRSADTDADNAAHKVKGKISLLNLFKKSASDAATPDTSSSNLSSNKASTLKSSSPSPVPSQFAGLTSPFSTDTSSNSAVDLSGDGSPVDISTCKLARGRLYSAGDVLTTLQSSPSTALHRAQSDDRLRAHSNPASFMSLEASGAAATVSTGRQSTRPTILRPHHRSVSSEQAQIGMRRSGSVGPPSARALRFDSTFSAASAISKRHNLHRQASHSPARGLKSVHSINSICGSITPDSPRSPLGRTPEVDPTGRIAEQVEELVSARALGQDEDEDEQYGIVVVPGSMSSDANADTSDTLALHTQLSALKLEGRRKKHSMLPTRTPSSPLPSPGAVIPSAQFEYPFSITSPPPEDVDSPMVADFASAHGNENRLRGDSMSSMSTTTTSGYLTTPGQTSAQLPTPYSSSNGSTPPEYPALDSDGSGRHHVRRTPSSLRDVDRSSKLKAALDIDIRSISTHAQAEALVQRAQRSILDMEDIFETDYNAGEGNGIGWTPLSAALAAYGESLAIERKFKEEEERQTSTSTARSASRMSHGVPEYPDEDADRSSIMRRLDRKFSLEEKSYSNTVRPTRARRPNTSTGSAGSELFQPPRQDGSLPSTNYLPTSGSQVATTAALSDVRSSSDFVSSLTPPKGSHLNVNPETYADSRPRLCRSRTPDPESDIFGPSSLLAGIPLSRVSTAPAQDTFLSPNRSLTIKERQVARATKLAKMGFASPDAWQNTMPGSRSQLGHKQRFAGIKGFVQSLKGK